MKVIAIDPDSAGGWAVVSSEGPKPVVLRSGLAGDISASEKFALLKEHCTPGCIVAVEYVYTGFARTSKNKTVLLRGNDYLQRTGYEWATCAALIVGDQNVVRVQARSWRVGVGLPSTGSKRGNSKKAKELRSAIVQAAGRLTLNIDPRKAELRQVDGATLYEASEADAVCMAVAVLLKH